MGLVCVWDFYKDQHKIKMIDGFQKTLLESVGDLYKNSGLFCLVVSVFICRDSFLCNDR